jgi:hypothetical protein
MLVPHSLLKELVMATSLGTSVALAAQRTYDNRLSAPPGGRLTFNSDVGSVAVVGRDAPEVVIHAELHGSESFLAGLHISAELTPTGVTISAHSIHGSRGDWFDSVPKRVRFAVEVPRDYPVDLWTSGGHLDVRDLSASVGATTSGGGAFVQNVTGAVNVHTSGGSIEAQHLKGPVEFSSSGGGIDVTDSTGDLDLRTSGGDIRIQDVEGRVHAATSGASIRAELRANRGISLTTSGGAITLLLPHNTHASIDAESGGGRVTCDFPLSAAQIAASSHLLGAIGGGGEPISLRTSGGSIHLAPEK